MKPRTFAIWEEARFEEGECDVFSEAETGTTDIGAVAKFYVEESCDGVVDGETVRLMIRDSLDGALYRVAVEVVMHPSFYPTGVWRVE